MRPMVKRRKLAGKIDAPEEEIKFDDEARHEFLTGFHKRKLQRAKHAQEIAEKRMKEEKREHKKRLREERQAELRRAFEEHKARMREINGHTSDSESGSQEDNADDKEDDESEWNGIAEPEPVDHTAEYIDEDKYTTVTVEEIDPTEENAFGADNESEDDDDTKTEDVESGNKVRIGAAADAKKDKQHKRVRNKDGAEKTKRLKKKRNFKYETKIERRVTRYKERTGNRKKAKERRTK